MQFRPLSRIESHRLADAFERSPALPELVALDQAQRALTAVKSTAESSHDPAATQALVEAQRQVLALEEEAALQEQQSAYLVGQLDGFRLGILLAATALGGAAPGPAALIRALADDEYADQLILSSQTTHVTKPVQMAEEVSPNV